MDNVNKIKATEDFAPNEHLETYICLSRHDHFGGFTIPLNLHNPNLPPERVESKDTCPPWLRNENDLRTFFADTTPLAETAKTHLDKWCAHDGDDTLNILIFASASSICKIITLVRALGSCWAYYDPDDPIKTLERKPSQLFNTLATLDFKCVLYALFEIILVSPVDYKGIKKHYLALFNEAMYLLLDCLAGWIPGVEVDNLRNTYAKAYVDSDNKDLSHELLRCLDAVGTRFAREEPKWEMERNKPTKKQKTQRRGRKGSGNKGPRTEKMAEQFSNLCHYMDNLGKNDRRSPRAKVFSFWQKNKERFERDADAQGESRGYPSAQHLYTAYQSKMSRRN